jgi:electron-transferring-flavoprotein dehydrogenase
MQSGIIAARTIFAALKAGAPSAHHLAEYDRLVDHSYIAKDLHRTRNMRLAFKDGFFLGGIQAALMTVTRGLFPGWMYGMHADAEVARRSTPGFRRASADPTLTVSKVDAVFKSGNATRDTIPTHLIIGKDISGEVARFYAAMCPAGVYEWVESPVGAQHAAPLLRISPPNCVDCKATDVLGPRWTPREGGSGPKYKRM